MKKELKTISRINILSLAKIMVLFGILQGILFGIQTGMTSMSAPITFQDALAYAQQDPSIAPLAVMVALGWWSLLVGPIVFGIIMFVTGLIFGLLYNLFAKYIGGIKIELD